MEIRWISTNPEKQWETRDIEEQAAGQAALELTGIRYQTVEGFGGCFNELSWIALQKTEKEQQRKIFDELFGSPEGCRFNFCRLPIGASDYAAEWYSHNEMDGDYGMQHFSIERDRHYLIPYIKEAMERKPDLKLFASPWSPPTWMKFPKAYNYGTMRWEKQILDAYALYFVKFVQAYAAEGIPICQVHVQNEPVADQKFPSCVWTGEQLRDFIRDYLGPAFEQHGLETEIWLGTLNCPYDNYGGNDWMKENYDRYAHTVLSDERAYKYIKGVGYQWGGKNAIAQTHESWPEMRIMQTENECGDGRNSWGYARYVFNLFRHYFTHGTNSYIYWNMILEPKGKSTWGWEQNSLITLVPDTGEVVFNPEFYLMKHFSRFVRPGAVRLGLKGRWTGNALAFGNPDGEVVVIVSNPFAESRKFEFKYGNSSVTAELKPESFNTFTIKQ